MKALDFVKQAIKETQRGIEFDRTHKNEDRNTVYQPNMKQALSSLEEAQKFFQRATSDKGGHRKKAMELVQQAIEETRRGIEFDQTHRNDDE